MDQMLRLHAFGGLEQLHLDNVELRAPAANEVKLTVTAAGITQDQLTFMKGALHPGENVPQFPITLGYEVSGIVTTVGSNVDSSWIGKRVAPIGPYDTVKFGGLGDAAIVPADRLVEIPDELTFVKAAALWVPYLTAYAIRLFGNLKSGDTLLLPAATSTVSHAAIQLAKNRGINVIGTTRSKDKADLLKKESTIDHVIVTSTNNLKNELTKLAPNGVNAVFDPIGGAEVSTLADILAPQGILIEFGVIGGLDAPLPVADLIGKGLTIRGYAVDELIADKDQLSQATDEILTGIKNGWLQPKVAQTFELTDYKAAFEALKNNQKIGRIIITD